MACNLWFCSVKVNLKIWACKKVTVTANKRIQAGFNSARRWKAKINSQLECTIITKILASEKMFKTFIPPQTDGMIHSSFDIGCSESKVIFKSRKNNKNNNEKRVKRLYRPLQGANVRTSCISQTNTVDTASQHTEKPAVSLR